jgi:hypothetical protein
VTNFKFKNVLNPVETPFVAHDREEQNPITLMLRPTDTDMAFDANRWMTLVNAGRVDEANELQFQIGLRRISGWQDVKDEDGNEVKFEPKMFAAFSRLVNSIPYIMKVGEQTLMDLDAVPNLEQGSAGGNVMIPKAEMICEARVIPGEPTKTEQSAEPSESNTETQ